MSPRSLLVAVPLLFALSSLPGCFATEDSVEGGCSDATDNDNDGLIDCEDADCGGAADCSDDDDSAE